MKKTMIALVGVCVLLAGCSAGREAAPVETTVPVQTQAAVTEAAATEAAVVKVFPLQDNTMEVLEDSMVAVSLENGDVSLDEDGKLQMKLQVYSYDRYDMVDIAALKAGDVLVTAEQEILIETLDRDDHGAVLINGGLDLDGMELVTDDSGVFYARGYSDMKSWYLVGEAICPVADGFVYTDSSDLDKGTVTFAAEDFLADNPEIDYYFQPQNTMVRLENGEIVTMERVYTP